MLTGEGATVPMRLAAFLALLCALAGGKLSEGFVSTPGGAASRRSVQAHHQRGLGRHAELCIRRSTAEPQEGGPESLLKATDEEDEEVKLEAKLRERELERKKAQEMAALNEELAREKQSKVWTAIGSVFAAVAVFFYQHLHPVEAVTLLRQMQQESPAIQTVVANGRPTLVDFYAEWCENCKEMAPTLRALEGRYKNKVNFVVINGDTPQAADMVEKFRVDGIPHFALISKEGEVRTALIGKIPKQVMEADLDALLAGSDLPYEGYDAFEDEDHFVFGRQEVQQGQQL